MLKGDVEGSRLAFPWDTDTRRYKEELSRGFLSGSRRGRDIGERKAVILGAIGLQKVTRTKVPNGQETPIMEILAMI